MKLNDCYYTAHSAKLARAVGSDPHIVQVTVGGLYPSAAAFARALIAEGVDNWPEKTVLRHIRDYGSVHPHDGEHGAWVGCDPGALYAQRLDGRETPRKVSELLDSGRD